MDRKLLGIDEAGRGPVIGSMFLAGVVMDEDKAKEMRRKGARDSKKMSKGKRRQLYSTINEEAEAVYCTEVTAPEIDYKRQRISLNELEAEKIAGIIEQAIEDGESFDVLVVDVPDPDGERFMNRIRKYVDLPDDIEIKAEHGADETYPVCSTASIIAKVNRDKSVEEIEKEYGIELRSGYSHEDKVIDYLKDILKEEGEFPDFVRTSWETAKRVRRESEQSKLKDYGD